MFNKISQEKTKTTQRVAYWENYKALISHFKVQLRDACYSVCRNNNVGTRFS